jgi:hypothetical protein
VIVLIPEHRRAELQLIAKRWVEEHKADMAADAPEKPAEALGVISGPEGRN